MRAVACTLLDPGAPGWPAAVDALWAALGAPDDPTLFPAYFVKTTFVKMGGRLLALAGPAGEPRGAGLLFPRGLEGGGPLFTLRLHSLGPAPAADELLAAAAPLAAPGRAVLYSPADGRSYSPTHADHAGFDIGAPAAAELPAMRAMQRAIWGDVPGGQYPDDLHSAEFGPGSSLAARRDGRLAGFLFGFFRLGGLPGLAAAGYAPAAGLSIESQLLAVAPEYRRHGLAATLKRAQARDALARGIPLIHWTADPLQFANATLNFAKLRAVAGEHYPAYYPFQNALNRVSASRLGLTWLPGSAWGRAGLAEGPRARPGLGDFPGCAVLNAGPRPLAAPGDAPFIAVEIPADWTALQAEDPAAAAAWRAASDAILAERLGFAAGRYLITDVAAEGERRYLVGRPYDPAILR